MRTKKFEVNGGCGHIDVDELLMGSDLTPVKPGSNKLKFARYKKKEKCTACMCLVDKRDIGKIKLKNTFCDGKQVYVLIPKPREGDTVIIHCAF